MVNKQIKEKEIIMKKALLVMFCILLVGCVSAEKKQAKDIDQINQLFQVYADSMSTHDLDGILSVYSEDAILTTTGKNGDKLILSRKEFGKILSDWKLKHYDNIGLKAKLLEVRDIKITGNSATATATFQWTTHKGTSSSTYKFELEERNGRWSILKEI